MRTPIALAAFAALTLSATPAMAFDRDSAVAVAQDRGGEQEGALALKQRGNVIPLPQLRKRVQSVVGNAEYVGSELHGTTLRMKFIRGPRVIWVDVDARTGRILDRSDN